MRWCLLCGSELLQRQFLNGESRNCFEQGCELQAKGRASQIQSTGASPAQHLLMLETEVHRIACFSEHPIGRFDQLAQNCAPNIWQGTWHDVDWWEALNKYLSIDWDHFESESESFFSTCHAIQSHLDICVLTLSTFPDEHYDQIKNASASLFSQAMTSVSYISTWPVLHSGQAQDTY